MDFTSYILPELLILVPVLYLIGYALKQNKRIADENIPLTLCLTGVILAFLYILSTTPLNSTQAVGTAIFAAITQGILVAGAAVLGNQIIKQGEKVENNKSFAGVLEEIREFPNTDRITNAEETEGDASDGSLQAETDAHTEDKVSAEYKE